LSPFTQLTPALRPVLVYYLASPLFWLLDVAFDWDVRLAFLQDPQWKTLYFSVLLLSAVTGYIRPGWLAWIALLESGGSIVIHILSFMLPVFTLADKVLQGEVDTTAFSTGHVVSFLLAGLIMSLSFQQAIAGLRHAD
jgi:uncharacterized membrane protein YraQ (UPF0718 family)